MTNKLVVIINSLKYQKLRKFYYMKWNFLHQITAASRTKWLPPPDPRPLCPLYSTEFVEPPPKKIPAWITQFTKDTVPPRNPTSSTSRTRYDDKAPAMFTLNRVKSRAKLFKLSQWTDYKLKRSNKYIKGVSSVTLICSVYKDRYMTYLHSPVTSWQSPAIRGGHT